MACFVCGVLTVRFSNVVSVVCRGQRLRGLALFRGLLDGGSTSARHNIPSCFRPQLVADLKVCSPLCATAYY